MASSGPVLNNVTEVETVRLYDDLSTWTGTQFQVGPGPAAPVPRLCRLHRRRRHSPACVFAAARLLAPASPGAATLPLVTAHLAAGGGGGGAGGATAARCRQQRP